MSGENENLRIEPTRESIQTWAERPYLTHTLRNRLRNAEVIIVPNEGYAEDADLLYFPVRTEELFHFLRERGHDAFSVEICIEDSDYKELALHADLLTIATVVVQLVVAPVVVQLILDYLRRRLGNREKDSEVKSKLTIVDEANGRSLDLSYKGPAAEYKDVMVAAISKMAEQTDSGSKRRPPQSEN
jgi:hypothetical protein